VDLKAWQIPGNYRDRFYVNDGKGNYKEDSLALPENFTSKFCVRAMDYDKDGDLDLFIAEGLAHGSIPSLFQVYLQERFKKRPGEIYRCYASIAKGL
jgi:hypothetical protein